MNLEKYSSLLLRLGLGIVFLYFGINKFINPLAWSQFLQELITRSLPLTITQLMYIIGIIETLIGLLLIIGLFTRIIAILASLYLAGIIHSVFLVIGLSDIVIRDFGLFLSAVSLTLFRSYSFRFYKR